MQHWLLVRGRGGAPLDARVDAAEIAWHVSSRRPAVATGDRAILYAAEWQAVFGVVEIIGEPEHDPSRARWAWRFPIRPTATVPTSVARRPWRKPASSRRASGATRTSG